MADAPSQPDVTRTASGNGDAPAQRLWQLWQQGQRPDLRPFLSGCGELSASQLAAVLRVDQRQRWLAGQCVPAESYLTDFPAVATDPEAALDLIYSEYLLREELGAAPDKFEYRRRFPQFASALSLHADLHAALGAVPGGATVAETGLPQGTTLRPEAAPARRPSAPGRPAIPGYEVFKELGRGGMGVVYEAVHIELRRPAALKMILSGAHAGPEELERFRAEAQAVARLQHPNIVQIYEVGEQDGLPFCALEFVDGGSLDKKLKGEPQPPRYAAAVVQALARAMHAAHQAGVVHRDLKPGNVLLTRQGTPKITDFGLAKRLDDQSGRTRTGAVMGTPSYMAPEQASGRGKEVGPAADVWALGAILYEMLTGRPPFRGTSVLETLEQVCNQEPVAPRQLQPKVSRDLETICLKCLQKEPARRYARAEDLADDLKRFLAGEPTRARPVGRAERAWRWCRRRPVTAALITATLLTFALGLGFSLYFGITANQRAEALAIANGEAEEATKQANANAKTAEEKGELAVQREREARQLLYPAQISQIADAWSGGDIVGVQELLAGLVPRPGQEDLRGFEWQYFWRLAHGYKLSLGSPDAPCHSAVFTGTALVTAGTGNVIAWEPSHGHKQATIARDPQTVYHLLPTEDKTLVVGLTGRTVKVWELFVDQLQPLLETTIGPKDRVSALAAAPDASALAILVGPAGQVPRVRCWDLKTGKDRFTSPPQWVRSLAFAPDSKTLAVGVVMRDVTDRLHFWDAQTGKPKGELPERSQGLHVTYSPNGKLVATASDQHVGIWDVAAGKRLRGISVGGGIGTLAFAPDGKLLAVGGAGEPGPLRFFDVASGRKVAELWGHTGDVRQIVFSTDGTRLVSTGSDGTAKVWEVPGMAQAAEPRLPSNFQCRVNALAFRPDGKYLVTAGEDTTALVWDLKGRRPRGVLIHPLDPVRAVAWSPDGRTIATGTSDRKVFLWDPTSGLRQSEWQEPAAVQALAFSPDGQTLAVGTAGGRVQLRLLKDGKPKVEIRAPPLHVSDLAFSPDGKLLAAAANGGSLWLWDAATGAVRSGFPKKAQMLRSVAFAPDGKTVAAGCRGLARMWSVDGKDLGTAGAVQRRGGRGLVFLRDGKRLAAGDGADFQCGHVCWLAAGHNGHQRHRLMTGGEVTCLTLSPKGDMLAAGTVEGPVELLQPDTGEVIARLPGHAQAVVALAYSPDGKLLAQGRTDFTVHLRDAETGAPHALLAEHTARVSAVAFSPDGKTLASGSADRAVLLWDVATGKPQARLTGHEYPVRSLAFSPDGTLLASGDGALDRQGEIKLWDARTGNLRATLKPRDWSILALAFSPDGKTLASGTGPEYANLHGRLSLWDVASGREVAKLGGQLDVYAVATHRAEGHARSITGAAFSPDGRLLATAGADHTVRLWDVAGRRQLAVLRGHDSPVVGPVFSADGRTLFSADEHTVRLWDVARRRERAALPLGNHWTSALAVRPDGRAVAVADRRWGVLHMLWAADPADVRRYEAARSASPPPGPAAADVQLVRARTHMAAVLLGKDRSADAEEALRQASDLWKRLADGPAAGEARQVGALLHTTRGQVLLRGPDTEGAVAAFREAIRLQPDYADAYIGLGDALRLKGDWAGAYKAYGEVVFMRRDDLALPTLLGEAALRKGDPGRAVISLELAARRNPDDLHGRRLLATALWVRKDRARADVAFLDVTVALEQALEAKPQWVYARHHLAFALDEWTRLILVPAGRHEEALEARRRCLELAEGLAGDFPDRADYRSLQVRSHSNLAWLLATCADLKFRDPAGAVTHARKATELAPKDGSAWSMLGTALYRAGQWREARDTLEKAAHMPRRGDSFEFFFLAMCEWQLGNKEKARQWYDKAVAWMEQHRPKDTELRRLHREAAALLGLPSPPP